MGEVARWSKQPGMSRYSSQNTGVFVLNFALDNALPKSSIVGGGRNGSTATRRRVEEGVRHAKHGQVSVTKLIQPFIGKPRQHHSKNDEANVAVYRDGYGIGGQRKQVCSAKKLRRCEFFTGKFVL